MRAGGGARRGGNRGDGVQGRGGRCRRGRGRSLWVPGGPGRRGRCSGAHRVGAAATAGLAVGIAGGAAYGLARGTGWVLENTLFRPQQGSEDAAVQDVRSANNMNDATQPQHFTLRTGSSTSGSPASSRASSQSGFRVQAQSNNTPRPFSWGTVALPQSQPRSASSARSRSAKRFGSRCVSRQSQHDAQHDVVPAADAQVQHRGQRNLRVPAGPQAARRPRAQRRPPGTGWAGGRGRWPARCACSAPRPRRRTCCPLRTSAPQKPEGAAWGSGRTP